MRRKRRNKQRKLILITSISLLFILTVGYAAFQTNLNITAKGNIKFDEGCVIGNEWTYDYKDNTIYDFAAPCAGTYKLETWGAQGGNAKTLEGGYGGYSTGNIELKRKQQLYIVVGGQGESAPALTFANEDHYKNENGGYNGGGNGASGQCNKINIRYAGSGGGATHIAFSTGLLTEFENKLNDLIIVSGAGGGAYGASSDAINFDYVHGAGSAAGGYVGNVANFWNEVTNVNIYATGGTQSSGGYAGYSFGGTENYVSGFFGRANKNTTTGGCSTFSGGGAGFYGGGYGHFAPSAGGSSYINNSNLKEKHMTCYKCTATTTNDSEGIKTISTDKVSEQPLTDTPKKGNGYAKITLIHRN